MPRGLHSPRRSHVRRVSTCHVVWHTIAHVVRWTTCFAVRRATRFITPIGTPYDAPRALMYQVVRCATWSKAQRGYTWEFPRYWHFTRPMSHLFEGPNHHTRSTFRMFFCLRFTALSQILPAIFAWKYWFLSGWDDSIPPVSWSLIAVFLFMKLCHAVLCFIFHESTSFRGWHYWDSPLLRFATTRRSAVISVGEAPCLQC